MSGLKPMLRQAHQEALDAVKARKAAVLNRLANGVVVGHEQFAEDVAALAAAFARVRRWGDDHSPNMVREDVAAAVLWSEQNRRKA
jgi:hypothetical protein